MNDRPSDLMPDWEAAAGTGDAVPTLGTAPGAPAAGAPSPAGVAGDPADPIDRRPGLPTRDRPVARRRRRTAAASDEAGAVDPGEPDAAALAMARTIVDLAADKKASDIVLLDVRAQTAMTDYFIICSGGSERQLAAIADGIAEGLKESGVLPIGREGSASSHWTLLDYGAAIVHVMAAPERDYYGLEKLWADAPLLLHVL